MMTRENAGLNLKQVRKDHNVTVRITVIANEERHLFRPESGMEYRSSLCGRYKKNCICSDFVFTQEKTVLLESNQ